MSEKNVVPPEGMLKAASIPVIVGVMMDDTPLAIRPKDIERILESALLWLSENPIVPTESDMMGILQERVESGHISGDEYCAIPPATVRYVVTEWQRRMFLAPQPEVSEELKGMMAIHKTNELTGEIQYLVLSPDDYDSKIMKAYRLGQKSKVVPEQAISVEAAFLTHLMFDYLFVDSKWAEDIRKSGEMDKASRELLSNAENIVRELRSFRLGKESKENL